MKSKNTFTAQEIIDAYRLYKRSGLQIDFLVYLRLVEEEPPPNTIEYMGRKYILKKT